MATPSRTSTQPNPLALCVPALARAGQILCTVVTPALARDTLRQAAAVLEGNSRFLEIPAVRDIAERCHAAAEVPDETQLVPLCRQLAAATARQVTALAQEIQQQARGQTKPAMPTVAAPAAPPTPPAAPTPAKPPTPVAPREPVPVAEPTEKPRRVKPARPAPVPTPEPALAAQAPTPAQPVEKVRPPEKVRPAGRPQPVAKPEPAPGWMERLTVARTAAEKSSVMLALANGNRFAVVGNGTIIDTRTNVMWAARVGPTAPCSAAKNLMANLRLGNYANWRLPTPDELKGLLADDGYDFARGSNMFAAEKGRGAVDQLWTSESRRRFWLFGLEVTCLSVHTGGFSRQKPATPGIAALAVRAV